MRLEQVDAGALAAARSGVAALVRDAVEDNASIGFVLPVDDAELGAWVDGIVDDVAAGRRIVVLALDGDAVAGMIHLEPAGKANARHRAEVQKLIVHRSHRGAGLGRRLLEEVEAIAAAQGRTLILLDTERGSAAERLYQTSGYDELGVVPGHALRPDGVLWHTTFFQKQLDAERTPPRALLLTGLVGSGKTSVAIALGELLEERGEPYALVDLDWLGWANLPGATPAELIAENLRAIRPGFERAGARWLVLTRHLRSAGELDELRAALVGLPLTAVRLQVPRAELERRIRARDEGAELAEHLELVAAEPPPLFEDAAVAGNAGTPREVGLEVLRATSGR
jgi:GNAT superfamily N-acetyltransferase